MRYEIRVDGILDESWSDWFDGLQLTHQPEGVTLLSGTIRDEAALHGLIRKICDLGLPLISLARVENQGEDLEQ
jgi:hypothetical protein